MVKLTNVISWTEQNCCVRWDSNDFKFPGILQGRWIFFKLHQSKNGTSYVNNLVDIFDEKYYRHLSGGILKRLENYSSDMKVFLYPMLDENGDITTSENLKVHPRMKELYKFLNSMVKWSISMILILKL
jgi:hypothetical protein